MAHIDEQGLLWADDGDIVKVEHHLRQHDYGPLTTPSGLPTIFIYHLTGNHIEEDCYAGGLCDGALRMDKSVASGGAHYYAHAMLDRGGVLRQEVPFTRSAIAVSGKWQGQSVNHIANHLEVVNGAWAKKDGYMPGGHIDPTREDYRQHGSWLWQMLDEPQLSAILEIAPAWMLWSGADPEDVIRGHVDVNPADGHVDPGPELRAFLDGPVRAKLESIMQG